MDEKETCRNDSKQYLTRLVLIPAVVLVAVYYATGRDLRCVIILVVLVLALNLFYWFLRLGVRLAPWIRRRLPDTEGTEDSDSTND